MIFDNIESTKWIGENFPVKLQSPVSVWLGRTITVAIVVSGVTLIAGSILNNRAVVERAVWALGLSLLAKCIQWYQGRDPKFQNKTPPKTQEKQKNEKIIAGGEGKKIGLEGKTFVIPPLKIPGKGKEVETEIKKKEEKTDSKTSTPVMTPPLGTPRKDDEIKTEINKKSEGGKIFDLSEMFDDSTLTPIKTNELLNETSTPTGKLIKDSKKERKELDALLDSVIKEENDTEKKTSPPSKITKITDEEGNPIDITFNLDKFLDDSLLTPEKESTGKIPKTNEKKLDEGSTSTGDILEESNKNRQYFDALYSSDEE
jgi:hypothetical protein